jgi:rhodanese-related sulfurtransferase
MNVSNTVTPLLGMSNDFTSPRDRPIAAYCQVGQRGYLATRILLQAGYEAANIGGGYKTFRLFHPN